MWQLGRMAPGSTLPLAVLIAGCVFGASSHAADPSVITNTAGSISCPNPTWQQSACSISLPGTLPALAEVTNVTGELTTVTGGVNGSATVSLPGQFYAAGYFGSGLQNTALAPPAVSANGPTLSLQNNATLTVNDLLAGVPSGAITVISTGAEGLLNGAKNNNYQNWYTGGQGGAVTLINAGSITYQNYVQLTNGNDFAHLRSFGAALGAFSIGGKGGWYDTHDDCCGGNGGAGGSVTVATQAGSQIQVGPSGGSEPTAGIFAFSTGGAASQQTIAGSVFIGTAGAGGPVTVVHDGQLANQAANAFGIVAASVGRSGDATPGDQPATSGGGGSVQVTLNDANAASPAITMSGSNAIGILALSAAGLNSTGFSSNTDAGGTVTVTINPNSTVAATGGGQYSIGVLAVSSGTASLLSPFTSSGVNTSGGGYSGAVSVTNGGAITTSGDTAIGIAAISTGGAAIVANATGGGLNYLGNSGTAYGSKTDGVTVVNTGSIITDGANAHGIEAVGTGGGGLLRVLQSPAIDAGIWTQGSIVGGNSGSSDTGHAAGPVVVWNSGSVETGSNGNGLVAMGIVAQSIGGGGGSAGGSQPSLFVGDAGGSGGDADTVTVTNSGRVTTNNDGAVGILAQSIGGGGGNGANAAGIFVAVGGEGGNGGSGNAVTVSNTGSITTGGDFAAGAVSQSIGGGGGNGGYGTSAGLFVSVAIGGTAGGGGDGGAVLFSNGQLAGQAPGGIVTSGQDAIGVLAQSIGGGGGNGGAANSYAAGIVFTTAIAVGGTGGSGGSGAAVGLDNQGAVTTTGADAIGILAQSIGGGGGGGGASLAKLLTISVPDVPSFAFASSIGGAGGAGGSGGSVLVRNAGPIATQGDGAQGILAQSIGGGGGNGGDSTAASHALAVGSASVSLSLALGATGGGGGSGGPVAVFNSAASLAALQTFSLASVWPPQTLPPNVSLPDLSAANLPLPQIGAIPQGWSDAPCSPCVIDITTSGQNAPGITAQSIGGGGGNGTGGNASTHSANIGSAGGSAYGFNVGLGASGGAGGAGSTVIVVTDAGSTITTTGSGSPGILAQSIGGGGGSSSGGAFGLSVGSYSPTISAGGNGVTGSNGGAAIVRNAGAITTWGGDATGILAQSIGGGGGLAGSADAATTVSNSNQAENAVNIPTSNNYDANLAIGGKGGGGGNGGIVAIYNTGSIATAGERAYGIEAQSIGAGGGNGGTATATAQGSTNSIFAANVAVGGSGGAGGTGGDVSVVSAASIVTRGYAAVGILAQSIGGGGGVGGDGSFSANTTLSLGAGINGGSGATGTGAPVGVVTAPGGAVTTYGDDASAILAQSLGGGGGTGAAGCNNAASSVRAGATSCTPAGITAAAMAAYAAPSYHLNVGGGTAQSGNGNTATVDVSAPIVTHGDRSLGVVAQTVGGGGGYLTAPARLIAGTGVGENAGVNGATGGPVNVNVEAGGSIETAGAGSWGILAQSVGGGGGFAGDPSLAMEFPQSNTLQPGALQGNGFANTVTVNVAGNITTTGPNAHGIFAQAVGGSGGIVAGCCNSDTAQLLAGNNAQFRSKSNEAYWGSGGAISITQQAGSTISTSGLGSIGIVAQSSGVATDVRPITISIGGSVIGGTNGGSAVASGMAGAAGILVSGGGNTAAGANTITVNGGGAVSTQDGVAGTAITAGYGLTNVVNSGTITGSILLGSTPGTITNNAGGTLVLGSQVVAASLTNSGTMQVQPGRTALSGSFAQNGSGVFTYGFDAVSNHTLAVSGGGTLGGSIVPVVTSVLLPFTDTILTAGGIGGVSATTPQTLLFGWNLQQSGNAVSIAPTAALAPPQISLNPSEASLAAYFGRAWSNADAAFGPTFAYLYNHVQTQGAYTSFLDQLSPRGTQAPATVLASESGQVLGAPLSCPQFEGSTTILGEGTCVWAKLGGAITNLYDTDATVTSATYRIGGQKEVAPGWFVGGTLGLGTLWADEGAGAKSSGPTYDGSVAVKRVLGPWLFAGSFAVAGEGVDNSRYLDLPPGPVVLTSNTNSTLVGGRARAAYDIAFTDWYVRPFADLDVVHLTTPGYSEPGASTYALNVRASNHTDVVIAPAVELGGRYDIDANTVLRGFVGVGARFRPNNARTVAASFIGASGADGTFQTTLATPNALGTFGIGIQIYQTTGWEVRAGYDLSAGGGYLSQGGTLRAAYRF